MFALTFWMAIGILAATMAGVAIGMGWYGALAKPWMRAAGLTPEALKKPDGSSAASPLLYAGSTLSQLVMAAILSGIIHHSGGYSVRTGLISAALCWVGFVATTTAVNNAFQQKTFLLTLIDAGYWLCVMLAMGAIIGFVGR